MDMGIADELHVKPYTVSQITSLIRDRLEEEFFEIWVEGEVSDCRVPSSGHIYFLLKDEQAQIRCILFKGNQRFIRFQPEDGMKILVRGKITVYERRGEYQLICDYAEPLGSGALQKAFEQLKKRLAQEGLFDEKRKRPIPLWPERIGIVTSPTGAAIRDILNILDRRFATVSVLINPVRVQGEGAAEEIARAIRELEVQPGVEVIIVTRGGGSLEDLWAFNEEVVARAIYACRVPVISAVGHEIDYTISDFTSDLRAPTPSAAAELVILNRKQLEDDCAALARRLVQVMRHCLDIALTRLKHVAEARVFRDPYAHIRDLQETLDEHEMRLLRAVTFVVERSRQQAMHTLHLLARLHPAQRVRTLLVQVAEREKRLIELIKGSLQAGGQALAACMGALDALSPLHVLRRGYSICWRLPEEGLVRDAAELRLGDLVRIRFHKGKAVCEVKKTTKGGREDAEGNKGEGEFRKGAQATRGDRP